MLLGQTFFVVRNPLDAAHSHPSPASKPAQTTLRSPNPRMITLRRTVRCIFNPPAAPAAPSSSNTFAGTPTMQGLGRYYEFQVSCRGEPNPVTAYLIDIKDIDRAIRAAVQPAIAHACEHAPHADPAALLAACVPALADLIRSPSHARPNRVELASVRWFLSPWYSVEVENPMPASPISHAIIRERFDLAASHRLNVPTMTPEENRAAFGKCNNPSGHGHNYQFEPAVRVPLNTSFTLADLEAAADAAILSRFDHTHLNLDTDEFAEGKGVNPSVENIAQVFFRRLDQRLRASHPEVELAALTVWETDRTCATFER
jgi:6-pyruvoyltetrahydropterin/6-carboxytetrahydropterin synthase